jgi:hypothetical protein
MVLMEIGVRLTSASRLMRFRCAVLERRELFIMGCYRSRLSRSDASEY